MGDGLSGGPRPCTPKARGRAAGPSQASAGRSILASVGRPISVFGCRWRPLWDGFLACPGARRRAVAGTPARRASASAGRARIELERPVVTLERWGAPAQFITSLPERTQYFLWSDGRVPVVYRPRRLHVLDAIEWETPRAATHRDARRALERYLGAWPAGGGDRTAPPGDAAVLPSRPRPGRPRPPRGL
jgi:hypothetical protein